MVPNPCRKAQSVVLLADVVSVIVCFSLEQSKGAQPEYALICELHLDGLYPLEFFFRLIASLSLIRKGLLGLEGHRPSDVAEVASALRELDAPMCEVLEGGLKCLVGFFLWRMDDDPFWKCGISILAFKNVHHRNQLVQSLSLWYEYVCGRYWRARMQELYLIFSTEQAASGYSRFEVWMRAISRGFWSRKIYIAALVTSSTLLLVCEAKLSLEAYTWCISWGFYIFLLAHPLNTSCSWTDLKSRAAISRQEPQLLSEACIINHVRVLLPKVLVL